MFSEITGGEISLGDAEQLLTTKETLNYWTSAVHHAKELEDNLTNKVVTRFHYFTNPRYLGVSQCKTNLEFTYCFSVWDLTQMACVQRMFLPHRAVLVHTVINDRWLVYTENRRLKLMNMKTWTVEQIFPGKMCNKWTPSILFIEVRNGKCSCCLSSLFYLTAVGKCRVQFFHPMSISHIAAELVERTITSRTLR